MSSGHARQKEIKELYGMMKRAGSEPYECLATDWISKWLAAEKADAVPRVDNSSLLCSHNR